MFQSSITLSLLLAHHSSASRTENAALENRILRILCSCLCVEEGESLEEDAPDAAPVVPAPFLAIVMNTPGWTSSTLPFPLTLATVAGSSQTFRLNFL